ncbi:MAG: hypothetical protein ACFB2X_13195 [Rivularia sp. (in: cyanobacteria)]
MSLIDSLLLTLVSTVICLVLPKLTSLVFGPKSKPKTISKRSTMTLKEVKEAS